VSVANRVLDVVHLVAQSGPITIAEIAERTGIPLSTAHRVVRAAVDLGCLDRRKTCRGRTAAEYGVGPRTVALTAAVTRRPSKATRVEKAARVLATALPRAPREVLVPLAGRLVTELDGGT
jgi:DNA-binding IclR family transcriptional regulator